MLTTDDATKWVDEHREELTEALASCDDEAVQMLNRAIPAKCQALWDSGCWLEYILRGSGATDDQVKAIQLAHGQRSFIRDPFIVAVGYANEFVTDHAVKDKPGRALANEVNDELFGTKAANPT